MEVWFRPYIWTDYRLAVLFMVVIPLILLIWAFVQKVEGIQRLLTFTGEYPVCWQLRFT